MPYVCYYEYAEADFCADDITHFAAHRVMVDLYITARDRSGVEKSVEDALTGLGICYEKTIDRDNDNHCYVVEYQVVV